MIVSMVPVHERSFKEQLEFFERKLLDAVGGEEGIAQINQEIVDRAMRRSPLMDLLLRGVKEKVDANT